MGLFRVNADKAIRKAKRKGLDVEGALFADYHIIDKGDLKGGTAYLILFPDRIEVHRFGPPSLLQKRDAAIILRDKISGVGYREERATAILTIAASNAEAEYRTNLSKGPRLHERLQRWAAGVPA